MRLLFADVVNRLSRRWLPVFWLHFLVFVFKVIFRKENSLVVVSESLGSWNGTNHTTQSVSVGWSL